MVGDIRKDIMRVNKNKGEGEELLPYIQQLACFSAMKKRPQVKWAQGR